MQLPKKKWWEKAGKGELKKKEQTEGPKPKGENHCQTGERNP